MIPTPDPDSAGVGMHTSEISDAAVRLGGCIFIAEDNHMKKNIRILTECAIMIAASTVLSFFKPIQVWTYGGGATICSMLPLVIIARRHGTKAGLFTAFAHSVLQLLFGLGNVQYATSFLMAVGIILLDYVIAYTVIGLSGIFSVHEAHAGEGRLIAGISFSLSLRLLCHFLSGWIIWEALWPNDLAWAAPIWSIVYNASYMVPELILTGIAACIINRTTKLMDRAVK